MTVTTKKNLDGHVLVFLRLFYLSKGLLNFMFSTVVFIVPV